jgi:bifunctional DNA-binding transcriptional regulator/antitoxin component of YhaV-PrlF toxin-antitoxin module
MKPIIKTVVEDPLTGETFLQFTEPELKQLGLEIGDKFDIKHLEDGSIVLEKYGKVGIELGDLSREVIEMLIAESCERDVSINVVVSDILRKYIGTD